MNNEDQLNVSIKIHRKKLNLFKVFRGMIFDQVTMRLFIKEIAKHETK